MIPADLEGLDDLADTLAADGDPGSAYRVRALLAFVRASGLVPDGPMAMAAVPRSGRWPKVERDFLRAHPACAVTGRKATVGHHVVPVHVDRSRELDPTNLIGFADVATHLWAGHAGNWSWSRPDVREWSARERAFRESLRQGGAG